MEDGAGEGGATAVYGRRNPWGSASYADLISQAISGSPDGRLTLSQIYDWMVAHVPYFTERQETAKSAGWKVRQTSAISILRKSFATCAAPGR